MHRRPGRRPSWWSTRRFPYSTDPGTNPQTYQDVRLGFRPHDVGEIWALALWEVWWNLVDREGFDPDLVHGSGGNNAMLQLVIDGLKLGPCNPTFLDGRDALLTADEALHGGAHACDIWRGFAKRGVGLSASSGPGLDVSESFDLPLECVPEVESSLASATVLAVTAACARRRRRSASRPAQSPTRDVLAGRS